LVASLLESVIVTPLCGAGADNVIGNDALWPSAMEVLAGNTIDPKVVTTTVALAGVTLAALVVAVTVAEPPATAVTGTATLVA